MSTPTNNLDSENKIDLAVDQWVRDRIITVLAEHGRPMTRDEIENAVFADLTGYPGPTHPSPTEDS